jgi:hypothetical protein
MSMTHPAVVTLLIDLFPNAAAARMHDAEVCASVYKSCAKLDDDDLVKSAVKSRGEECYAMAAVWALSWAFGAVPDFGDFEPHELLDLSSFVD